MFGFVINMMAAAINLALFVAYGWPVSLICAGFSFGIALGCLIADW